MTEKESYFEIYKTNIYEEYIENHKNLVDRKEECELKITRLDIDKTHIDNDKEITLELIGEKTKKFTKKLENNNLKVEVIDEDIKKHEEILNTLYKHKQELESKMDRLNVEIKNIEDE